MRSSLITNHAFLSSWSVNDHQGRQEWIEERRPCRVSSRTTTGCPRSYATIVTDTVPSVKYSTIVPKSLHDAQEYQASCCTRLMKRAMGGVLGCWAAEPASITRTSAECCLSVYIACGGTTPSAWLVVSGKANTRHQISTAACPQADRSGIHALHGTGLAATR